MTDQMAMEDRTGPAPSYVTRPPPVPTGRLLCRVGFGAVLPDVVDDLGLDPQAVFQAAGVDIARCADQDAMIPLAEIARLLRTIVEASGRPDLGVLAAERAAKQPPALIDRLVRGAPDLRSALHEYVRHSTLVHRDFVSNLTVFGTVVIVTMPLAAPFGGAAIVSEDAIVCGLVNCIRELLGPTWAPSAVMLSHGSNLRQTTYRRFFRAPVRFNSVGTALEFPAADLERPNVGGSIDRRAGIIAAADAAAAALAIGFEEKVRGLIRAGLSDPHLSVGQIAAASGMSRRSLNRRLAARGVTVAGLLRSVRFATARQLLVESETSLSEIAAAIGYAEPSVFSNAFRAWSGVSPREWRRQHGRAFPNEREASSARGTRRRSEQLLELSKPFDRGAGAGGDVRHHGGGRSA